MCRGMGRVVRVFEMQKITLTLDTSKFSEVENLYSLLLSFPVFLRFSRHIDKRLREAPGRFICLLHLIGGGGVSESYCTWKHRNVKNVSCFFFAPAFMVV